MISKRSSQEDEKAKGEIIEGDLLEQEEKMKRAAIAIVAIFVAWSIIDFIIHGILLQDAYTDTESLWRSMNEMKMGLLYFSTFIVVILFVSIYSLLISNKGLVTGIKYGLLFGLAFGISMGYGSYAVMPIPYSMALTWFLGSVIEVTIGGLILGAIVKA